MTKTMSLRGTASPGMARRMPTAVTLTRRKVLQIAGGAMVERDGGLGVVGFVAGDGDGKASCLQGRQAE